MHHKIRKLGTGEMGQWLKALAALTEDSGPIASTHNGSSQPSITPDTGDLIPSSDLFGHQARS